MAIKAVDYDEQVIDSAEWQDFCKEIAEEFPRWKPNYSTVEYWEAWKRKKENNGQ